MISKECFTTEWIAQKSIELQYNDKNLIEKVIRAFSLLEMAGPARWRPAICLENSLPMIPWDEREIHELKAIPRN